MENLSLYLEENRVIYVGCNTRESIHDTLEVSIEVEKGVEEKYFLCMLCVSRKLTQLLNNLLPDEAVAFLKE